jgi:type IV pilus assembly protein PilM
MVTWPLRHDCPPIALDMGRSAVRLLQFRRVGRGVQLAACASRSLSPDAMVDNDVWRREVVQAGRQCLASSPFHGKDVVTALSCQQLIVQNTRLPKMARDRLEQAVLVEVQKRSGDDEQARQVNYFNAGDVRVGGETQQEIITLTATQDAVEGHLALVSDMGLRPVHVDVAPIAMFHVFERYLRRQEDADTVTAVVEIGFTGTRVVVASGGRVLFLKSIDIGGRHFTDAVAREAGLNFSEAVQLRYGLAKSSRGQAEVGSDDGGDHEAIRWSVYDTLRAQVQNLAKEISLCLRYCSVTFRGLGLREVSLAGGEVRDPMFNEMFRDAMSLECIETDPFHRIDPGRVDLPQNISERASWAVCAGLGLYAAEMGNVEKEAGHDSCRISA